LGLFWKENPPCQKVKKYKGKIVSLKPAPHPLDLIWENLELKAKTKFKIRVFNLFLALIYLGVSFSILGL
jgi:hypothetical protein